MELTQADIRRLYGDTFFVWESGAEGLETHSKTKEKGQAEAKAKEREQEVQTPKPVPMSADVSKPPAPVQDALEPYLGVGPTANWKLKKQSELALIVLKSEFSDKNAMANLKNLIVGAGIDTSKIGFGVIEDGREGWNFSDMPVGKGIIFAAFSKRLPSPAMWKGKQLYAAAPMQKIMDDDRYAKAMNRLLEKVKTEM